MSTINNQLKSNTNTIIPKTRSEWVIRSNNEKYEASLANIYTIKFKATADYASGDSVQINNVTMLCKMNNYGFKNGSIVECE